MHHSKANWLAVGYRLLVKPIPFPLPLSTSSHRHQHYLFSFNRSSCWLAKTERYETNPDSINQPDIFVPRFSYDLFYGDTEFNLYLSIRSKYLFLLSKWDFELIIEFLYIFWNRFLLVPLILNGSRVAFYDFRRNCTGSVVTCQCLAAGVPLGFSISVWRTVTNQ